MPTLIYYYWRLIEVCFCVEWCRINWFDLKARRLRRLSGGHASAAGRQRRRAAPVLGASVRQRAGAAHLLRPPTARRRPVRHHRQVAGPTERRRMVDVLRAGNRTRHERRHRTRRRRSTSCHRQPVHVSDHLLLRRTDGMQRRSA